MSNSELEHRTAEVLLTPTMRTALEALASHQEHVQQGKQPYPAWNTVVALEKRGLVTQQVTKYGLLLMVTVAGFHLLGRRHPHE